MDNACRLYPDLARISSRVMFEIKYNMGRRAGTAYGHSRVCVNLAMARQNFGHIANDTIPHEIAHIICSYFNWDNGHGRMWKRVAASLGIVPNRCFSTVDTGIKAVTMRQRTKYLHKATCGTEIWVGDVLHKKIMNGDNSRLLRNTGGRLSASTYTGKFNLSRS
jgi:predicted SprT family Zn-dependent metalloprotease